MPGEDGVLGVTGSLWPLVCRSLLLPSPSLIYCGVGISEAYLKQSSSTCVSRTHESFGALWEVWLQPLWHSRLTKANPQEWET